MILVTTFVGDGLICQWSHLSHGEYPYIQTMKRRKVIRNLVLFSLGAGVIYSCKDKYEAIKQLNLKYIQAEPNHLDLLDDLSRLILPLQQIPELVDHTALPFILNTVDQLFDPKDRQLFIDGYKTFDTEIATLNGKLYSEMEEVEKLDLLKELNEEELVASPALYTVFNTVKNKSIQYLTTSEYYQRKVNYYEMTPGRFHGDVALAELKNMNDE